MEDKEEYRTAKVADRLVTARDRRYFGRHAAPVAQMDRAADF